MKTQRILAPVDGSKLCHFALDEADKLASQSGGELTLMFVHEPATAQTIIEHSGEYDLIVMSTHGHSGLKHFHLGSVAERVVRGSHCDVLVVKQPSDTTD
jgi:nucleotide-binding universal stress UspA family protein